MTDNTTPDKNKTWNVKWPPTRFIGKRTAIMAHEDDPQQPRQLPGHLYLDTEQVVQHAEQLAQGGETVKISWYFHGGGSSENTVPPGGTVQ